MRARVRERTQRVIIPAALQEQRAIIDGYGHARATRRELFIERTRIVAALRDNLPRPREDRRELAVEKPAIGERDYWQPFGAMDVVIDVAILASDHARTIPVWHDAIVATTELIVWERDGRVQKVKVPNAGLTIGRKPAEQGASYCTTNPSVSRTHCRIARGPDGWIIEDLGSASGTKINGELAKGSTLIQIGDVVMIGDREGGLTAQLVDVAPPPLPSAIRASIATIDDSFEASEGTEVTHIAQWEPVDKIRTSYDIVAERYATELADDMIARPFERGMFLAFSELVGKQGEGVVGDVGCGPGHIAKHLTNLQLRVVGFDVSVAMIEQARLKHPDGKFYVGSMFELPAADNAWIGAVSIYATLHTNAEDRARAFAELRRVIQPGGYFLHSFFISAPDQPEGSTYHLQKWFGHAVDLPTYFVSIEDGSAEMDRAGFDVMAALVREPMNTTELPTRRCYMLGKRR